MNEHNTNTNSNSTPDQIVGTIVKGALGVIGIFVAGFLGINVIRRSNARTKIVQNASKNYGETLDAMVKEYKEENKQ